MDIVDVDAPAPGGEAVSDLADCATDVIQRPQPGVIVGGKVVSGRVLVKEPGRASSSSSTVRPRFRSAPGGHDEGHDPPDAGLGGGKTNSARFFTGLFTIQKSRNAIMTLASRAGTSALRGSRALSTLGADAKRKRQVRKLWGDGKGRFTTKGRYSSATVRGTKWLVHRPLRRNGDARPARRRQGA